MVLPQPEPVRVRVGKSLIKGFSPYSCCTCKCALTMCRAGAFAWAGRVNTRSPPTGSALSGGKLLRLRIRDARRAGAADGRGRSSQVLA
jgi:hypothetical protein